MKNQDRVIIGEIERAGLPISQPFLGEGSLKIVPGNLRFVKRDGYFTLQECCLIDFENGGGHEWRDVPCIEQNSPCEDDKSH